jgi:hypothetical protein
MCAGILAGVGGLLALISGDPLLAVLIGAGITFAYCFGWYLATDDISADAEARRS